MRNPFNAPESLRRLLRVVVVSLLAPAAVALAQENPLSDWNRTTYTQVKRIILRSAEKMPEENYSFKPTEAVRSYGQIIGHVADSQYTFCSVALGEKNPLLKIEKNKTTKAELIAALKDAFAYCDKAYDAMTDKSGAETVSFFRGQTPKTGVLNINQMHTMEHYGNLVTYMRLKDIVPPTSEPGFMPTSAK